VILQHVGIVVARDKVADAVRTYLQLGYKPKLWVRRDAPWIGEMVGRPGADIEIVHMAKEGHTVGIELLAYFKDGPPIGVHHLAFEVESISDVCASMEAKILGMSTIPDGPNVGACCAYVRAPSGETLELIVRPNP